MRQLRQQNPVNSQLYKTVIEDAHALLPECMIPLVLGCKQVVLVGDHQVRMLHFKYQDYMSYT